MKSLCRLSWVFRLTGLNVYTLLEIQSLLNIGLKMGIVLETEITYMAWA